MLNVRNHHLLTSKFNLYVIDLTCIELATDEDKENNLEHWAKIFKAKTWEELRMLAEKKADYMEASEELFQLNQDKNIQMQCMARQEYYNHEIAMKRREEEYQKQIRKYRDKLIEAGIDPDIE